MRSRGAGTRACRADTRVGACARPPVILRAGDETCFYRVVLDVPDNAVHFNVIANPMIVGLPLPETFSRSTKKLVGFASSHAFQRSKNSRRRNFRQEQLVDVVGHQDVSPEIEMAEFNAAVQGSDYELRYRFRTKVQGAFLRGVEIAVHPDEGLAGGCLFERRISALGKAAVQMPRYEEPFAFGVLMGQAAHIPLVRVGAFYSHPVNKRRHECPRHV
jgi:hypothetical protein